MAETGGAARDCLRHRLNGLMEQSGGLLLRRRDAGLLCGERPPVALRRPHPDRKRADAGVVFADPIG